MALTAFSAIGVIGFALSIGIYHGTLRGSIDPKSWHYPAANLFATILISLSLIDQWNITSALMSAAYGLISVYSLHQHWNWKRL